jgi:DHA1 family bicyclomycin/chloramphenicol resistance-like MFS transporter
MSFLILGRIIEAFGACGMLVGSFAIVRDVFSEEQCAHVYSFLNSTISLSPLLAPLVGGYLAYFFNWRATFVFLALVAAVIFLLAKKNINETLDPKNKRNLRKEFFMDYLKLFKNSQFCAYTFCSSSGLACFLTFFSSSSYIIINLLKIPEQHFGFYFATIGISFFLSSLFCGYITKFLGVYKTVLIGGFLMFISGLSMWFWYQTFGLSAFGFMGPMMIMSLGGAFVMGAGAGGAIAPFPEMAGTASALFGCMQFVFAFLVSQLVLYWQVKSTLPLSYTLMALGISSVGIMLLGYKKLKHVQNAPTA